MFGAPTFQLGDLVLRQSHRVSVIVDTIPQILSELDPLSRGKMEEIGKVGGLHVQKVFRDNKSIKISSWRGPQATSISTVMGLISRQNQGQDWIEG